jgi:CubicO group peptidase (beta-lactamase class C family)
MKALRLLVLLTLSAVSYAQTAVPDTPAAHQFSAWLDAFNRADRAAYLAFLEKNLPDRADKIDQEMDFRGRTGGFDLRKVQDAAIPTKIVVLLQEHGSDRFAQLTLEAAAAEPHAITLFEIHPIERPAEFGLHLTEAQLIASLKTKLEQDSARGAFSGAALLAHGSKPVFAQAYGLADREHKTPNTLSTRFRIGSMNKMFTAVAVLQLAEQGKLSLDDPLGKFLADYPNKDVAQKVTVRHLLTHTGGTGDFFGPEYFAHRLEIRTFDDYVKLFGSRPLRFEPGTKWEYSNYGFLLLGIIIEKASGENYYDYVRDHIYKPAGMTSTGSEPEDVAVPNRSIGYTTMPALGSTPNAGPGPVQVGPPPNAGQAVAPSAMRPNTDTLPYRGTSAGGGYSTVEDLLRFAEALEKNKLLNAQYTELLTTGKQGTPNNSYAFGFEDRRYNGVRCIGHGGGSPGMNGQLRICPSSGYVVAVLANQDPPAAERIADFILNRLPDK